MKLSDELIQQELAETTAEQNHRGDKIRELLKENERLKEENAVLSRHEVTDETVKRDMITVMEENERLKADLNKMTQSYQAGLLVRDELKAQVQERGERMELFRKFLINRSVDEEGFVLLWWTIFWRGHKECEDWFDEGKAI